MNIIGQIIQKIIKKQVPVHNISLLLKPKSQTEIDHILHIRNVLLPEHIKNILNDVTYKNCIVEHNNGTRDCYTKDYIYYYNGEWIFTLNHHKESCKIRCSFLDNLEKEFFSNRLEILSCLSIIIRKELIKDPCFQIEKYNFYRAIDDIYY